ncbi:acyl-CoA thioesterase [Geomonas sp. Red32]|uniref:acyl-CoA thioesterase n=1 Tax=Geomonas sp. Red32 TaxID=2912856 RepID=UPI00202CF58E|nr:acyl-CoA thioesterase [Geomonas sp. Red32]
MGSEKGIRFHECAVRVRFNEVDAYRIAWHGHYVTWMEEGRHALAREFGLDPAQMAEAGFFAPVVELSVRFLRAARYGEELLVQSWPVRRETATIEFRCRMVGADGKVAATGRAVHALTDLEGALQYRLPPVIADRLGALFYHHLEA